MTGSNRTHANGASSRHSGLTFRSYTAGDALPLGHVFHRAVHEGAAARYSEAERAAWSPRVPDTRSWELRLAEAETVVAETAEGPLGFMSLDLARGYLDLAFVVPEAMGTGISSTLYAMLEGRARAAGLTRLETEASLLAEPFFRRQGWRVVRRQKVERLGQWLSNAVMEKTLRAGEAAA